MDSAENQVIKIGELQFEAIKVSELKLNTDNITAEVVLDVKVGDILGKLTVHKLNLITMKIEDTVSDNKEGILREVFANISINLDDDEAYTIEVI